MMWQVRRAFGALVLTISLLLAAAPGAEAAPYAAIVMDMRTGEVVHSRGADRRQHPASLTKMMTIYLTLEALETGQLDLDQKVRVSRKAARQPPSKLGLRPGQRVTVRSLLRATAIKSANDAAMVLAEAIGGSQRSFARLMTDKARELGMASTTFKNPHGLTQRGHLSTARDMARLARALYFDFPEYYNLFGRKVARAAGKRVYTTNRLLSTYRGAEGMKTGYTRAAGYNLAASAKRGERRVIAVLMGGKTSRWRNARMAKLLDMGFARTPARAAEIPPARAGTAVAAAPLPPPRPGTKATGLAAIGAALASPAAAAVHDPGSRFAPLYAELPKARPGSARGAKGARSAGSLVPLPAGRAAARGLAALPGSGVPIPAERPDEALEPTGWEVQVGAFRDRESAERRLESLRLGDLPMLSRGASRVATRSRAGRSMYLVRFHGLEAAEARAACARLKRAGRDCLALAPR